MIFKFLFFLYRIFFSYLIYGFLLPIVALFNKKIRKGILLRIKDIQNQKNIISPKGCLWIHAASGELEYAKPILRQLKKNYPELKTHLTYFSPSYLKAIAQEQNIDSYSALPFDLKSPLQSFIKKHKPKALLIARSDLWPELLYQLNNYKIPILLFSHSKKEIRWIDKIITKNLYQLLSDIFVVSQDDQYLLNSLGLNNVTVAGDTRFDQIQYRLHFNQNENLKKTLIAHRFLLAGSTWPEDNLVILQSYKKLLDQNKSDLCLAIAPHELEDLPTLLHEIKKIDLDYQFYTDALSCEWSKNSILIIDQMGLLSEAYKYCQLAFVGGSFRRKVHSVMEPLGANKLVLVGPHYKNNREAEQFSKIMLHNHPLVKVTYDIDSFYSALVDYDNFTRQHSDEVKKFVEKEFNSRLNATSKVMQWIETKLEEPYDPLSTHKKTR